MFLLWLRQLHLHGDQTPASVPPPAEGRSSPTNTSVFPPSSFVLPSFSWFYIFFSTGQVILSTPSWCSACTSVSEGVFLIYPWREMYFMSTYSSTILSGCTVFITATQICGRWKQPENNLNEWVYLYSNTTFMDTKMCISYNFHVMKYSSIFVSII